MKKAMLWAMTAEAINACEPEHRMWLAAVEETIRTALGQVRSEKASAHQQAARTREQARREIFTEDSPFEDLCDALGLSVEFIRRKTSERIKWKASISRRKLRSLK